MFLKLIFIGIIFFEKLVSLHAQVQLPQCECLAAKKGEPLVQHAQPIDKQNIGDICFENSDLKCDPNYPYSYADGRCNNAKYKSWGMTNHIITRLLPAYYSQNPHDPPESPRVSYKDNVTPLKSSRILSTVFFPDRHIVNKQYTLAFMVMSQFFTHDVMFLKLRSPPEGACCKTFQLVPKWNWDRGCLSIDIPVNDPYYSQFRVKCMQFTRAMTSDEFSCPLPEYEQGNDATSIFDGSIIYGSSEKTVTELRLFQQGKMKFEVTSDGRVFLPHAEPGSVKCFAKPNEGYCFLGTDFRLNQHPQLTVISTIMVRIHNLLCDELIAINYNNPKYHDDEIVFQQAKKILVGILQNIFFGRFAEILLGPDCAAAYGITSSVSEGQVYETGYDPELNPGTTAEFQHVVWRAFHTLIEGELGLYDESRTQISTYHLSDVIFNPTMILIPGIFDSILIGLATQPMHGFDRFFSKSVTEEFLKQDHNNKFGSDLVATDIMRGRDCGMAPYVILSTLADFPVAHSFEDLKTRIDPELVRLLKKLYATVFDVESLIGTILEKPFGDSLTGKTLHAILAEQFRRYKFGNSRFYTFDGPGKFSPEQLMAIKSTSLSLLMCYGSDNLQYIQRDAFTVPSDTDELISCQIIIDEFLQQLRVYWIDYEIKN